MYLRCWIYYLLVCFFFSRMNLCKNRVEEASMQLVAGGGGENNGVTQEANNSKPQNRSTLYNFASDVHTDVLMFSYSLEMDCFYFLDLWMNLIIWNRFEPSYFESIGLMDYIWIVMLKRFHIPDSVRIYDFRSSLFWRNLHAFKFWMWSLLHLACIVFRIRSRVFIFLKSI